MKAQVIAGGILLLMLSAHSQASSWRGIVPLKSTRSDVERLFGKPNGLGRYEFDSERAYIYYSKSPCDSPKDCECLVPNDTVLYIIVTPEIEMKFSKLKIDRTKYQRKRSTHLPTVMSYSNEDKGIIYTVDGDEVTEISYIPSERDCRKLLQENGRNKSKKKNLSMDGC